MTDPSVAFAALTRRPELADAAAHWLHRWRTEAPFRPWAELVEALVARGAWDTLFDSFYRVLPFGTGGRRGAVGVGPNRMNPWTLGTSVQGNISFLRERFGAQTRLRVVIAADVREFRDLRGAFPKDVANPLLGLTSVELARQAAAVYAAHGVEVFLPPDGTFAATPELSFLIRQLGAHGGLNVSASHNHPDDNGGKFYTEQGAQEVPPDDERMVEHVQRTDTVETIPWAAALASGLVSTVPAELHDAYLREAMTVLRGRARGARVVFTNLHGVGDLSAGQALRRAGFEVHDVPSQAAHDGGFPGVRFRAPNPEYPTAFEPALEVARAVGADLVLATDPDADRIGCMVPDGEGFRFIGGQELSALIAWSRFRGAAPGRIGIKTEVTTSLFTRVVEAAGGRVVGDLLVGCKYIAQVMRSLETTGRWADLEGSLADVLIGTEESHGFLLTPGIRDKDAAAPALVLAELASECKAEGRTLLDALLDLYRAHGAVANVQVPLVMTGAVGRARIEAIQASLRAAPPVAIGGSLVLRAWDRRDPSGALGPVVSETDRAARDVLAYELDGARLVIRPSGTEPKTKIYAEVVRPVAGDVADALAAAAAAAEELALDFVRQALARIDLPTPEAGLRCSPLLGIDERIVFGERLLPALLARADEPADSLRGWLRDQTAAWGDGLGLTEPAARWWLARGDGTDVQRATVRAVWSL